MTTRVSKVANVIIPVADQDRALKFYTEALGLEMRVDMPFGDGNRWTELYELNKERVPRNPHGLRSGMLIEVPTKVATTKPS